MRKWFVSIILAVSASVLAVGAYTFAATSQPATGGGSGQGLEISPPVLELSADPGQTVTTQIRVRNVTTGVLLVRGEADDFGAGTDESGSPKILMGEGGSNRFSLKNWISAVPDLELAPQELKTNVITIKVPANAEPGGHYAVVRFTGVPASLSGTGVSLSASVGTLILMRVNGPITENLNLVQFATGQVSKSGAWSTSGFFDHGPVGLLVRLKNAGSIHENAQGGITVTNMFGHKVAQIAVNPNGGNVLPDSIRRFEQTLATKALLGKYTAHLSLTYSDSKTIVGGLTFWVVPWKLVLLALVGVVVVGYLIKISIRRYNEHIIAMARRR